MRRSCVAFLLILGAIAPALSPAAPADTVGAPKTNGTITVGQAAPPVAENDLTGQAFSLAALQGRPVLIDFGSVLCEACAKVVGELNRLVKKYENTDLEIVMIADGSMPEEMTRNFFLRLNASFRVLRDKDWLYFDAYGVTVVPYQVLIDRSGRVRDMHLGFDDKLEKTMPFEDVLQEKAPD